MGANVARELSRTQARVLVMDRATDVSHGGATKANSGIVHAGFDDKPGTRRAQFCWPGNQMFRQLDSELHFGYQVNGSLVVARCEEDLPLLDELMARGAKNGVQNLRIVQQEELRRMEPGISPDAIAALYSPDAGTVTPYEFTIAVAENAAANGVDFKLSRNVTAIAKGDDGLFAVSVDHQPQLRGVTWSWTDLYFAFVVLVATVLLGVDLWFGVDSSGFGTELVFAALAAAWGGWLLQPDTVIRLGVYGAAPSSVPETHRARFVVNAAGCGSDKISRMAGGEEFDCLPRWGEYLLLHKDEGKHARHVLFPCPGKLGKGIVLQPTLWGNLLLGPTARDQHNKAHRERSNRSIIEELVVKCRELAPGFNAGNTIHAFAGARAKNSTGDWVIGESAKVKGLVQAAGIDSPGLAASPAIAIEVVNLLRAAGLAAPADPDFNPHRRPIIRPKSGWKGGLSLKPGKGPQKHVVCKCELVTEAEIVDALHRPLPCESTQAVRKRTRAGMGHCQGKYCEPRVKALIAREAGFKSPTHVPGRPWPASSILPRRWLTDEDKATLAATVAS